MTTPEGHGARVLPIPQEPEIVVADGVDYVRQRRTADAFLGLQRFAAERLQHPEDLLVQLVGEIGEHGSVGLFAIHARVDDQPRGYAVAWYHEEGEMRVVQRFTRTRADAAYDACRELIDGELT